MKNLSGAPLYGRLLALTANIRLGRLGQTLLVITKIRKLRTKKFYNNGPRVLQQSYDLFKAGCLMLRVLVSYKVPKFYNIFQDDILSLLTTILKTK